MRLWLRGRRRVKQQACGCTASVRTVTLLCGNLQHVEVGAVIQNMLLLTAWRRRAREACIHSWPSQKQMEATECVILRLPSKLKPFFLLLVFHTKKLSFKTTPTMHALHTHFLWCGWRVEKTSLKERSVAFKFLLFSRRYASASSSFFFLASCASLDLHEENLSAPHFLHVQNVSSSNSEYRHFFLMGVIWFQLKLPEMFNFDATIIRSFFPVAWLRWWRNKKTLSLNYRHNDMSRSGGGSRCAAAASAAPPLLTEPSTD